MPTDYKIISKIQAPDGSIYEIKPSENANINTDGIYYVSATGTASALTGTINDLDAYYNGLKIVLYNGSGVNTNAACTLKINDLAAVSIKKNGTTNLGTIYNKTIAVLCYVDGVFYHNNYYDSNTTEDSFSVRYLATDTARVLQYSLCALTDNDKISSFTTNTSASTNTGKSLATLSFRMGFPIFYRAGSTIAANTTTTDYYTLYENKKSVDIRYSMCYYSASRISATGPTYLYMNVKPGEGVYSPAKQATSVSNVQDHIVCKGLTINELIDGNFYIYLGVCSSTSAKYTMDFAQDNTLYYYDGADDKLIEYSVWLEEQNNNTINSDTFGVVTPIAGQDIYASEDYPAIVCLEYNYDYDAYNPSEYTSHYLMYDITYIGSGRHLDLDWGYAVLTHNVSVGQRVDRKYLHRKWTYTLHPDLEDEHKQGFDIDSFLALNNGNPPDVDYICGEEVHGQNLIDVRSGTVASLYRVIDSSIQSFISSSGISTIYDKSDGPDLYIVLRYGISSSSTGINDYMYMEPGLSCVAVPRPRFYDYNTHVGSNPFYMFFSNNFWTGQPVYFSDYWGPVFYNFGKANFNQLNGTATSISIDFSRNLFQAYDVSGNQRSIPGYGFSSGVSIFKGPISGGSGGGTGYANVYGSWSYLMSDVTCPANTDTSVLSIDIPYAGKWKVEAQATLINTVSDHMGVDCFLLDSTSDYNRIYASTIVNVPLKVSGIKPVNGGANVYLSELINVGNTGHKVSLSLRPGDCSVIAKATHGEDDSNTTLEGMGTATHIIITRLSDDVPV